MTNYSVHSELAPPGAFALYGDGNPSIAVGHRYYISNGSSLVNGAVVGGKVWIPNFTQMPPQVKMQWYVDGYTSGVPAAEKTVDVTATGGTWQHVMLDTPLPMPAPGVMITVVVQWMPNEYSNKYLLATYGGKPNTSFFQSTEFESLYWSEYTSQEPNTYSSGYRIPATGAMEKASDQLFSYGIDIIVSDNYSAPNDPDSEYARLVADGYDVAYIVVQM